MKCPNCDADLVEGERDRLPAHVCPKCGGTWLTPLALNELEDESFKLGDDEKGTMVTDAEPSDRQCPVCGKSMRSFEYRFYDLQLEACEDAHGYWLDAGEDQRVLALMKDEEKRLKRSERAEDQWTRHLSHLRSGAFLEKVRNLFR